MQNGTRRTMTLNHRMLLQHLYNNSNDADRRQTAYPQNNARNHCTNTKIAFRYNASFSIGPCTFHAQWCSMNLHCFVNRAQCLASPVTKKQQQKQPKTKTVDIETQWQKPLSKLKNWSQSRGTFLHICIETATSPVQQKQP